MLVALNSAAGGGIDCAILFERPVKLIQVSLITTRLAGPGHISSGARRGGLQQTCATDIDNCVGKMQKPMDCSSHEANVSGYILRNSVVVEQNIMFLIESFLN